LAVENPSSIQVKFEFFVSIMNKVMTLNFPTDLRDIWGVPLTLSSFTIKLANVIILSPVDEKLMLVIDVLGYAMIFVLILLFAIQMLQKNGSFALFWPVIDLIQFISFMRYLDVEGPFNVSKILKITSLRSIGTEYIPNIFG
jgi:hypothetical protein